MPETAKHKHMKEVAKKALSQEYGISEAEFEPEHRMTVRVPMGDTEVTYILRPDLFHKRLWLIVEIGMVDSRKRSILDYIQRKGKFIVRYFPYNDPDYPVPPEFLKRSQRGTMTFEACQAKMDEMNKRIYQELRTETNLGFNVAPVTRKGHKRYIMHEEVVGDYINLPRDNETDESKIREEFYCGVGVDEYGRYSIFVGADNHSIVMEFMRSDYSDVISTLHSLKLADYNVVAGFGYLLNKTPGVKPFHHSWTLVKDGVTDRTGERIGPDTLGANIFRRAKNITEEDMETILEYFEGMLETNKMFKDTGYKRYPRISISADNLREEEVIPALRELGKVYAILRTIHTQVDKARDEIVANTRYLEAIESGDYDQLLNGLQPKYPTITERDLRRIARDSVIRKALVEWNVRIEDEITRIQLRQKAETDFPTAINRDEASRRDDNLRRIYGQHFPRDICSFNKFCEICHKKYGKG